VEFHCDWLKSDAAPYKKIRSELRTVMNQYVGPVRTDQGLKKALDFFVRHEWLKQLEAHGSGDMEVRNMLDVGGLIAEAALMRTESRGGHYRLDCPEPQDRWQKHIILKK